MTPKEKANDILDKFWLLDKVKPMLTEKQAKQCALIAVDEIMEELDLIREITGSSFVLETIEYYLQVKKEIELL